MTKALVSLATVSMLIAPLPAVAAGAHLGNSGGANGASGFAPGQEFIANDKLAPKGSTAPGASGFAPGQEFIANDKLAPKGSTAPGASGFSPGASIVNPK